MTDPLDPSTRRGLAMLATGAAIALAGVGAGALLAGRATPRTIEVHATCSPSTAAVPDPGPAAPPPGVKLRDLKDPFSGGVLGAPSRDGERGASDLRDPFAD